MSATPPVLLSSTYQHELQRQDEWNPLTMLYQTYEVEQVLMPDQSNCLAVQAFLKILGLPFSVQYRTNAEFMSPNGKIPFIKCGQFVVSELESIVEFVQSKGHSLSQKLEKAQRCDMRAFMSLVNNVLGNAETFVVWCDPVVEPITSKRYGSVYPFPLNYWVTYLKRKSSKRRLKAVDWLEKTLQEVYSDVDTCCKALSARLDNAPYFFDQPTELDALVFGHIYTITTTLLPANEFAATVQGYANLIDHCKRIEETYFNFSK